VDFDAREVTVDGRRVVLTHHEFELLAALARAAGRVLSRELILDEVWGYDFPTSANSLEVYVGYLRRKTEAGARVEAAVREVIGEGAFRTADLGGTTGTKAYAHAVAERVRALEAAA